MFALLMASLLQAQSCATLDQCFQEAQQKVERSLTVEYQDAEGVDLQTVMDCQGPYVTCQPLGDAVPAAAQSTLQWTSVANVSGQGFISPQNGSFVGYSGLRPNERLTLNRAGVGAKGFTIAVTISLRAPIHSQRVLTLQDETGKEVYTVDWEQTVYRGLYFMVLRRRATTGDNQSIMMSDLPWDFDSGMTIYGPRIFSAGPTPNDLYELYLTFRPDGKVEADWFSISNTTRDFLVSHLQDTGMPVASYPVQPAQGAWVAPTYREFRTLVVGGRSQTDVPILQAVYFREALTLDQRIGFHSRNLFFSMQGKEGTSHLAPGQRPCNSGGFLQITEGQTFETVCGPRHGVRATPLSDEMAIPEE